MKTKILVPWQHYRAVNQAIKDSGVKFYPFTKRHTDYIIEFEPRDHPLSTFLLLKYSDIRLLN